MPSKSGKNRLIFFFALALCVTQSQAFFDFLKNSLSGSSNNEVLADPVDPNVVRGVPDHLQLTYKEETFTCDNGETVLDGSSINDGYCDCRDKSDEPGTSACQDGVFHCINKGYKLIKIPSSRVDDGVCDCCDGSDEGVLTRCFNTCKQAADRERSAMEKMLESYRLGSSLREQLISTAKEDRQKLITQIEPLSQQISQLREDVQVWEQKVEEKENYYRTLQQKVETSIQAEAMSLLKVQSASLQYLAPFLSNLMQVGDVGEHELRHLVSFPIPPSYENHHEGKAHQHDDEIDEHLTHDEPYADSYGDDFPIVDAGEGQVEDDCDVVALAKAGNHNGHGKELRLLCHAPEKDRELGEIIFKLVKKYRLSTEAMYLLGYQQMNLHFIGSVDYAKNLIAENGPDSCPADFEGLENHCDIKVKLNQLIDRVDSLGNQQNEDAELSVFRAEVDTRRTQIRDLERNKSEGEKAQHELEKFKDHLDLLAMKSQCFDVVDGKFSYHLCMLDNIRQKEIDGHGNVSLGEFEEVGQSEDGTAFKLHFKHGQYCHAFGPRTADVTVVCGDQNILKAAREPSTCYYTLVFESPAGCTKSYADAAGLTPFL